MKLSSTWFALILIASALLLNVARNANAQSPSPHPTQKRNAAAAQHHATASPISTASNQAGSKPCPATGTNYSYSYHYYRPSSESPPVWFQILTTIILLCFTGGLWWTSFRQWRAITNQTESAERTFKITQRAEVTLGRPDGMLAEIIEPIVGEPLKVKIFLTNSGRTAARSFRAKQVIGIGDQQTSLNLQPEPVLKTVTVQGYTAQTGPITSTIASGGVFTHIARSAERLTGDEAEKIRSQELRIHIMGKYEYDDGFGNDEWRSYFLDFDPAVGTFVATDTGLWRDFWN